jgi:hypothetical protein
LIINMLNYRLGLANLAARPISRSETTARATVSVGL